MSDADLNRYALFTYLIGSSDYGWNAYRGCFNSVEDAKQYAYLLTSVWSEAQIVDLQTKTICATF